MTSLLAHLLVAILARASMLAQITQMAIGLYKAEYDAIFESLSPVDGKITGQAACVEMSKSKLPNSVLSTIWELADIDMDGKLDANKFAIAMFLIKIKLAGSDLPQQLPSYLLPPNLRFK